VIAWALRRRETDVRDVPDFERALSELKRSSNRKPPTVGQLVYIHFRLQTPYVKKDADHFLFDPHDVERLLDRSVGDGDVRLSADGLYNAADVRSLSWARVKSHGRGKQADRHFDREDFERLAEHFRHNENSALKTFAALTDFEQPESLASVLKLANKDRRTLTEMWAAAADFADQSITLDRGDVLRTRDNATGIVTRARRPAAGVSSVELDRQTRNVASWRLKRGRKTIARPSK
jgi:hypothetical protein